jgi:hypothetical protein
MRHSGSGMAVRQVCRASRATRHHIKGRFHISYVRNCCEKEEPAKASILTCVMCAGLRGSGVAVRKVQRVHPGKPITMPRVSRLGMWWNKQRQQELRRSEMDPNKESISHQTTRCVCLSVTHIKRTVTRSMTSRHRTTTGRNNKSSARIGGGGGKTVLQFALS